ncbi:LAFA_0D03730g1_1 [Lachancea sp. 'fantastica']|nr:LAFA_0D03730g1_1 [Lachancea sp. 'fantastica']
MPTLRHRENSNGQRPMSSTEHIKSCKARLIALKPKELKRGSEGVFGFFNDVFEDLFRILKNGTAVDDKERLLLTDTLGVWFLRTRQLYEAIEPVKSPEDSRYRFINRLEEEYLTETNCDIFFRYVVDFWDQGGTALTNSLNDLLAKLIQLAKLVKIGADWTNMLNRWISQTLEIPATMRVSYFLLYVLAPEANLSQVLVRRPNFVESSLSLMWTESLATLIGKCIASLLINVYEHDYKESTDASSWFELWEKPTMHFFQDTRMQKRIEVCVLIPIFKTLDGKVFEQFLSRNFPKEVPELIPFLKIGQELLIEEAPFENNRLVSLQFLETMLQQDQYKISVFELLTFSPKRSKTLASYIYDILRRNLHIFFVDIEVRSRNEFLSLFKHLIDRIRDSSYSLDRDVKKLRAKNKFPEEQAQKSEMITEAVRFVEWTVGFLKFQLAPGSQYQRQVVATKILKILVSSSVDKTIPKQCLDPRLRTEFPFEVSISRDKTLRRVLLDNLCDNFNDIRDICLELLTTFSQSCTDENFLDASHRANLLDRSLTLIGSYKGCEGGAKLIDFLFKASENKEDIIETVLLDLQNRIDSSRNDFMANIGSPVNGYFLSLSLIIANTFIDTAEEKILHIIDRSIDLIMRNWNNVECILCDDPFEQKDGGFETAHEVSDPQVISYAFRSIKDSSELLKTLTTIECLTDAQLTACGELMLKQLSTIRHSGAFQSLIPSFAATCQRCYKDQPHVLGLWLNSILESLETKTQFITRRSGGIPHIICSIVGSEKGESRPLLKITFERLMKIATIPVSEHEETVDLPQVNAYNCIKALFVESPLSDACAPYVYQSLVLCIQSFTSPLWSLRNCSFMLFSALQNRLFGKIGKNISARLFFARYNGVQDILRSQFEKSVNGSFNNQQNLELQQKDEVGESSMPSLDSQVEAIFLVLTLLSRLKQTPGFDGLDRFRTLVTACLKSPNWAVRQLAARTLPGLVNNPSEQIMEFLEKLFGSNCSQNEVHGLIISIAELVEADSRSLSSNDSRKLASTLLRGVSKFVVGSTCFATANAFVKLLTLVLSKCPVDAVGKGNMVTALGNHFIDLNGAYSIDGAKQLLVRSTLELLLKNETQENIPYLVALALRSPFFEAQIAAANFLFDGSSKVPSNSAVIVEALLEALLDDSLDEFIKLPLLKALVKLEVRIDYSFLMNIIKTSRNHDLRAVALEYAGQFVHGFEEDYLTTVSSFADDEAPFELREAALISLINATKRHSNIDMFFLAETFLYDDDLELRSMASEHLNKTLLELEPNAQRVNFSSTARMFARKMETEPGARSLALAKLKRDLEPLTISLGMNRISEDLFEVEPANQFRNVLEAELRNAQILIEGVGEEVNDHKNNDSGDNIAGYVSSIVRDLVSRIEEMDTCDGPMEWGSAPRCFSQLVCLRRLATGLDIPERARLDKTLRKFHCHPLVFELTDTPPVAFI